MKRRGWWWITLAVGVVGLGLTLTPGKMLHASTAPAGTALTIEDVENTGATAWHYLVTWGAPFVGLVLGLAGLSKVGGDRPGSTTQGIMKAGGGITATFVPGWVAGASKAAPAAAGLLPSVSWLQEFLTGLRGQYLVTDPVFWGVASLMLVLCLAQSRRTLRLG
jgi:hypothetical protein